MTTTLDGQRRGGSGFGQAGDAWIEQARGNAQPSAAAPADSTKADAFQRMLAAFDAAPTLADALAAVRRIANELGGAAAESLASIFRTGRVAETAPPQQPAQVNDYSQPGSLAAALRSNGPRQSQQRERPRVAESYHPQPAQPAAIATPPAGLIADAIRKRDHTPALPARGMLTR